MTDTASTRHVLVLPHQPHLVGWIRKPLPPRCRALADPPTAAAPAVATPAGLVDAATAALALGVPVELVLLRARRDPARLPGLVLISDTPFFDPAALTATPVR